MKFKKLEIHNINSIAEAVIDFERLMPEDQHIFMIWGPSGAGKSTILDAICMALFCKTPRLQSIAEKKENQYVDPEFQFSDKSKGIAINDLRQYLKRGTKEGYCSLQFVGNDSVTYTAKTLFSINRNGNLNNIEWSLSSENGQWSKVKEVEQQVITVTGLTYEQFCRTTMLAQGEFTKFMKSDQNAKAEILEKLTDTSIFSEIGRRIYEKYNAQKKAYEQLDSQNENIVKLTDEQIAGYQAQINAIDRENKQLDSELHILNQKATWLRHLAVLQEDVIHSEQLWQAAMAKLNSEDNLRARQLITRWEQTENERNAFLELRKLRQNASALAQTESQYGVQYQKLTAGYNFLLQTIGQTEAVKQQLQEQLNALTFKCETFANAPVISEKLKQFALLGQNVAAQKQKLQKNAETVAAIQTILAQKEEEIGQAKAGFDQKSAVLSDLKEKSKLFDLNQLTLLQANQKDRIRDLNEAKKAVQTLKDQQNEIKNLKKTLMEKQTLADTLTAQMQQEQQGYVQAQAAQDSAQKCYDSAAQSVHDFAKQVRATLKIGDVCPVCGQKVAQLLTNEAAEESLLKLKNELEEAKKAVLTARKRLDDTITILKTTEGELAAVQKDLQSKLQKQKSDLAGLEESCKRLQIIVDETILEQLERQIEDSERALKETEEKIAVSRKLNAQMEQASAELEKMKQQQETLLGLKHAKELEATKLQEETRVSQTQCLDMENQQAALQSELSGFLATTYPKWEENPSKTAQELTAEAEDYARKQDKLAKQQELADAYQRDQQQVERNIQQVRTLFDWPVSEKAQLVDKLVENWADFLPNCTVLSQNRANLDAEMANKESFLQTYYSEHPDIQEAILAQLANTTIETVTQLREQQTDAQNQVQNTHGQYEKAQVSLQKHQESKPVFSEGEDLAQIETKITEKNQQKEEKSQKIGQIQHVLEEDADNKRRYAETLAKLEALQQQVRQWERLNNVFGDSTGKTFRKIAQSFILQKLLDNTNYFLGMLSDRYELTGAGRELMILVKDKYLGDAPRPVEMVSGGESFLISIALALGLSNLAMQGISSDFLFIDEGISQLDGGLCDSVVNTLQQLHHIVHCNIGIISHLDVLAEKIPTKIVVQPVSHGTSQLRIQN